MFKFNRIYTVLFHICLWSVLFLCIFLWRPRPIGVGGIHEAPFTHLQILVSGLPFIAVFYLHAYWLIPAYLSRKRTAVYIFSVLLALAGVTMLGGLGLYVGSTPSANVHYYQFALRRIVPGLFFLMASASLGAFRENFRLERIRKEKETEHLRTELSFLRAQVNPHFMLNVLNSMALLARRKSDLLEPVLMELAGLMNYMLYDANNEKIVLADEIKYLRSYIDLQLLRFGDDVTVQFNAPELADNKYIEPMLLIPLVENAFKHGIGLVEGPAIMIDIRIEKEDRLSMTVKNKYNPLIRQRENKTAGIGLTNLKKRLALLYPGQFELNVMDNYHADRQVDRAANARMALPDSGSPLADAITTENWFIITLLIPLL